SVVAGQLPTSGDTVGSSWRRAVGGRSSSTWDESVPTTEARSRRDEAKVVRLRPNRWQQAEPTLWNVLNTGQENIIRGGVHQVRSDGSRFRSRPVRDISEDVRINRELWRLAVEMEKAVN